MQDVREQFQRDGYLFPLRVLSEAKAAEYLATYEKYEREGFLSDDAPIAKHHCIFPWVHELATNDAVLDVVETLLGPNILCFGSRPWNKKPNDPGFVSWHQDNAYFGLSPHEEVTTWTALTKADTENGCMRYLPGSHLWPDQVHRETHDPNNLLSRGQSIDNTDERGAVDVILNTGETSIHHERTVHSSGANSTNQRRLGYSIFYIPTHVQSTIGRRGALLVRGTDTFGYWDADPVPRFDLDPIGVEAGKAHLRTYYANATQEARR
jgi:non-heme Fe2+,alpha-ketoglutarate-dependent halogenase